MSGRLLQFASLPQVQPKFGGASSFEMNDDLARPTEIPADDDEERTEQARRVLEEYAAELREMLKKLRKFFN